MRAFFSKGNTPTKADYSTALEVNSCGYYRDLSRDISVYRPQGREDYHVIFVARGALSVDGKEFGAGSAYFFLPGKKQEYVYRAESKSLYYWAHFCGYLSRELAGKYKFEGSYALGDEAAEAERVFRSMTGAYEDGSDTEDLMAEGALVSFIALAVGKNARSSPFRRAEMRLKDCRDDVGVKELAEDLNMSEAHFIRSFKKYNGLSPRAYAIKYRMKQASALLELSDMSIGEIAFECGFSDNLYFSRAFKKYTGKSPAEYRRSLRR
ncbi:MAG: AraC family transcriptional regulator [Firmicutes bacterium]|nr:AraC family transcriptional regulator [Bacillota bacterium]MDY5530786.1 AraC family transcriptional regulator [Pumilibacteraceae bacterium]